MPLFNNRAGNAGTGRGNLINLGHAPSAQQRERAPMGGASGISFPVGHTYDRLSSLTSKKSTFGSKVAGKVRAARNDFRMSLENSGRNTKQETDSLGHMINKSFKSRANAAYKAQPTQPKNGATSFNGKSL